MKFRLLKHSEYSLYCEQLKKFEAQFSYPLGDKKFQIQHGGNNVSYFDFFKSLGQENVFVLEHKGKLLGAGCSILRKVGNQRFWYLCDFKLTQSVRGKNRLSYLLIRNFIIFYCRSKNLVVINMSEPKHNWLVKKLNSILFFLKLNVKPMYFYEWTYNEFKECVNLSPEAFKNMACYTNYGIKDIIIEGEIMPIIHIVDKDHASLNLPSHKIMNIDEEYFEELRNKSIFMLASSCMLKNQRINLKLMRPSYTGTLVFSNAIDVKELKFSSLEI